MQYTRINAREIAPGRWRSILESAGIDESFLKKKEGPCPMCGGKTRFFFGDKGGNGTWYCRYCGKGDGFALLQLYLELDFAGAARWIETWYHGQPVAVRESRPVVRSSDDELSPEEIIRRRALHKTLWESSKPVVEGDPVWKYLHNRIPDFNPALISKMLRFHPSQPYFEEVNGVRTKIGYFPVMVAMIVAPDGSCQDLHRTYLTPDGHKANVEFPKKTVASIQVKGGAIRLVKPTGNVLGVAEGIETALAAIMFKGIPCWATCNTSGMQNFEIPEGIEYLHIFADNDPANRHGVKPGFAAAKKLQEKAHAKGVTVKWHAPATTGTDMLDLLISIAQSRKAA